MDPATNQTKVYAFSDNTEFSKLNKPFKVMELKKGDRVTFHTDEKGNITSVSVDLGEGHPEDK
jgi:hypothetical protein